MPDTDVARAYQVGERLRACVAADNFPISEDQSVRVTASVGIGTLERPDDTPETIFKRADNALYTAKRRGRNRVVADAALPAAISAVAAPQCARKVTRPFRAFD